MRTLIIIFLLTSVCYASEIPQRIAIQCLMGEARGEGQIGMQMVGEVLRRRGTQGMYGCNARFETSAKVVRQAKRAWYDSKTSNLTNGATHFESIDFPTPYWAKDMEVVKRYKKHIFYKER